MTTTASRKAAQQRKAQEQHEAETLRVGPGPARPVVHGVGYLDPLKS